jgi:hypothetical protein
VRHAALLPAIVAGCAVPRSRRLRPRPRRSRGRRRRSPSRAEARHGPPATLGHLDTTPPEIRKEIDELVAVLLDPTASRDSIDAKTRLAGIGKPALVDALLHRGKAWIAGRGLTPPALP